jgi:hypothetical protein
MREFAEAFLLVFAQLSVGGLVTLAIPPFRQLERGFFKSTAAVYLFFASVAVAGWMALFAPTRWGGARGVEIAVWMAFLVFLALYLYSLYGEPYRLRARSYMAALLLGAGGLVLTSLRYLHLPAAGAPGGILLYPLAFLAQALLLGTACSGMLLGHWYLIDTGLTLTPFRRMHRAFVAAVHFEVIAGIAVLVSVALAGGLAAGGSLQFLVSEHQALLLLRVVLGPIAAYGLGWMIGRTLDVPQTMAATGLFYIALLAVVVGEILGRTILFRSALPL